MSSILDYTPILSYIGSVDITSAQNGSSMYNVFYESAVSALGNVLMFEYKLIDQGDSVIPDNVELGFISIENATNNGISNQWQIAVPAQNDQYDPSPAKKIAVRVYIGITGSIEVGVTKWSNELDVHNPPPQPVIYDAFYDGYPYSYNLDDLYVFLDIEPEIEYDVVKFIAAFYYKDTAGNTIWDVSEPLHAELKNISGLPKRMIHVPEFGAVSTTSQYVYVSVYAVYPYTYLGNNYYSVSNVSQTFDADPASEYSEPTIVSTTYQVYTPPVGTQIMDVTWEAPVNSVIPTYTVAKYILNKSTDNINWTAVDSNIAPTTLTYAVDVSSYNCGTTVYFQVVAISTNGTASPPSQTNDNSHLNIFKYASAVQNLFISNTSFTGGVVDMNVNFDVPSNLGCGTPQQFVIDIDGLINYYSYVEGQTSYSIPYTDLAVSQTGTVTVYLQTQDTNPSAPGGSIYPDRDGPSVSVPYIATDFVLSLNYLVYDTPSVQQVDLSWTDPVDNLSGWYVDVYKVYYKVNTGNYSLFGPYFNQEASIGVSSSSCGTTLYYKVVATIKNIATPGLTYDVTSNVESINIFKYATAPLDVNVLWALANTTNDKMDVSVTFKNPATTGCGTPLHFVTEVRDSSNAVISSKTKTYNASTTLYTENFDEITYSLTGTVTVFLVTQDTNSSSDMSGDVGSNSYTADNLPIYLNVVMNNARTQLTFDVITYTNLTPIGGIAYPPLDGSGIVKVPFYTPGEPPLVTPGVTVVITTLTNNEIKYSFTILPSVFGLSTFPLRTFPIVSNLAGPQIANPI